MESESSKSVNLPETYLEKKRKEWIRQNPDKWTMLIDTDGFQFAKNERTGMCIGLNKKVPNGIRTP